MLVVKWIPMERIRYANVLIEFQALLLISELDVI